jgi:hypothetical protein
MEAHGNKGYNIENIWQSIWGKIKEQMKNKLGRPVGTFGERNSQTPKIFKLPHSLPQPPNRQNLGLFYSNGLGRSSQWKYFPNCVFSISFLPWLLQRAILWGQCEALGERGTHTKICKCFLSLQIVQSLKEISLWRLYSLLDWVFRWWTPLESWSSYVLRFFQIESASPFLWAIIIIIIKKSREWALGGWPIRPP